MKKLSSAMGVDFLAEVEPKTEKQNYFLLQNKCQV